MSNWWFETSGFFITSELGLGFIMFGYGFVSLLELLKQSIQFRHRNFEVSAFIALFVREIIILIRLLQQLRNNGISIIASIFQCYIIPLINENISDVCRHGFDDSDTKVSRDVLVGDLQVVDEGSTYCLGEAGDQGDVMVFLGVLEHDLIFHWGPFLLGGIEMILWVSFAAGHLVCVLSQRWMGSDQELDCVIQWLEEAWHHGDIGSGDDLLFVLLEELHLFVRCHLDLFQFRLASDLPDGTFILAAWTVWFLLKLRVII